MLGIVIEKQGAMRVEKKKVKTKNPTRKKLLFSRL